MKPKPFLAALCVLLILGTAWAVAYHIHLLPDFNDPETKEIRWFVVPYIGSIIVVGLCEIVLFFTLLCGTEKVKDA